VGRLRICDAPSCAGMFIDASADGSQRHCSDRCLRQGSVTTLRGRRKRRDTQQPAASG